MNVGSDRVFTRFIPAGAGNTDLPAPLRGGKPVYPRWRGEHIQNYSLRKYIVGLSPLARGTPLLDALFDDDARFIPAGAGNTLSIHNCF